jgi:pyruvate carboxylase
MALFMTANAYSAEDILEKGDSISFPDSVIELFRGELGQNPGGFPNKLSKMILKDKQAFTDKPNEHLTPIDFDAEWEKFEAKFGSEYQFTDLLSYLFYPKVFEEYAKHRESYGLLWHLPTTAFFYGLKPNEEVLIELAPGKNILVRLLNVIDEGDGKKSVFFRLNGQTRSIEIKDKNFVSNKPSHKKASKPGEIGAPLQGKLSRILVKVGEQVNKNTPLFTIEAMKMESTVVATSEGVVTEILLQENVLIEQDDVVLIINS